MKQITRKYQRGFTPSEFFKNFFRVKRNNHPANAGLTGFTLIELLVVIAIIGLLASVVLVSVNSVRAKARDRKIQTDLNQIAKALQLYYDKYGKYPNVPSENKNDGCGDSQLDCNNTSIQANWNTLKTALVPEFIGSLPQHPSFNGNYIWYGPTYRYTRGTNTDFILLTRSETLGPVYFGCSFNWGAEWYALCGS